MSRKPIRFFLPFSAMAVALGAALVVMGVSIAAFVFVDQYAEGLLAEREEIIAEEELKLLQDVYEDEGLEGLINAVVRRAAQPSDNLGIVAVADATGKVLVGNVEWPDKTILDGKWRRIATTGDAEDEVTGYARAVQMQDGARVLVGRNFAFSKSLRSSLSEAMIVALGVLLSVTLGLGIWLNRYVLSRIDAIASTTRRISKNNLVERIPVGPSNTEFDHLGATLNSMLDRNQSQVEQMRLMTDAISHDLRLPLQRVRSTLTASLESSSPERLKAGMVLAINDADDALQTFNALLDIARAEAGVGKDVFGPVDLAALVTDVAELFEPVAEEKGQTFSVSTQSAEVWGQSMLLKQAFGNLLHNAIKFTPHGGKITIRLFQEASAHVSLSIEDSGPGIPAAALALAFQRFGRLQRDNKTEGKGLGLAIAAAFVKLHDGKLRFEDAGPGLRVVVTLPQLISTKVKTQSNLMQSTDLV